VRAVADLDCLVGEGGEGLEEEDCEAEGDEEFCGERHVGMLRV